MTWGRFDDGAPSHPKLLAAGAEAAWLWVCGVLYSNKHHLDGVLKRPDLVALYPGGWTVRELGRLSARLVSVGLWIEDGPVYRIHDYAQYQEEALKANAMERREYERQRKAEQRRRSKTADLAKMSRGDSPGHWAGTGQGQSSGTGTGHERGTNLRADTGTDPLMSRPPVPSDPAPAIPDPPVSDGDAGQEHPASLLRSSWNKRWIIKTGNPFPFAAGGRWQKSVDLAVWLVEAAAARRWNVAATIGAWVGRVFDDTDAMDKASPFDWAASHPEAYLPDDDAGTKRTSMADHWENAG